jgi:hypothetical protein
VVAAERDHAGRAVGGESADAGDDAGGVRTAVDVVAEEQERVALVERGQPGEQAVERDEIAVDVADRDRAPALRAVPSSFGATSRSQRSTEARPIGPPCPV